MIDDKEFEPTGFFGLRGIKPEVAREREYVRFEYGGTDAVFQADPALKENSGFVHWLVCGTGLSHRCGPGDVRQKEGGYVIQKHPVPLPDMEHIVAQIRPETAPVTEITYHDHRGMKHQRGRGCLCGAGYHKKGYTHRPYNETERRVHEQGSAHTGPDPGTGQLVPVTGPHRHTEEAKYMLNPNRERRSVPHKHRLLLTGDVIYGEDIVAALVACGGRRPNKSIASELGVSDQAVADHRDLARHIRRPVDHRFGGHGGAVEGHLDDDHPHEREVDHATEVVERPHQHKRPSAAHLSNFHPAGDDTGGAMHPHIYTERVPLPSTERRLDMHPRTRARLERGVRPTRWFFSIEGTPKNDAFVSAREDAFDVPSVTMWRAPELEKFAVGYLTESLVYIVPDSDWSSNPLVSLQAFECREYLRSLLGQDLVHVAAATPRCGEVCGHTGQARTDHKVGADDFIGEGSTPDQLLVLDRHPSYAFTQWAKSHEAAERGKVGRCLEAARNRIQVVEWLCIHATANTKAGSKDGHVKRSVSSIARYVKGPEGKSVTDDTVYNAIERLVAGGELQTVPPGIDLKRITKVRRAGPKMLYLGEDYAGGVTFSIRPDLRWDEKWWRVAEWENNLSTWADLPWGDGTASQVAGEWIPSIDVARQEASSTLRKRREVPA